MMNNGIRRSAAMLILLFIFVMAACNSTGKGNENETVDNPVIDTTIEPIATIEPSPEPTPMPYTAPLTGIGRETEASERPIAVMINNLGPARPQSGLTEADVVWEVLAEGGITRLVAIFQSTDNITATIGPIRSNRAYLIDIADSFGAVMAHAGSSPEGYSILQNQRKPYLDEISNAGTYFWRSTDRKAPHNLYSDLEKLRTGAEKKGYVKKDQVPVYVFSETGSATGGQAAKAFELTFSLKSYRVGYQYDETAGLYKRFINDDPHIDKNNDEQLSATNLIVFETTHKTLDNVGRLYIDLETGGEAYLFQQGKMIEVDWVRSSDGMVRILKDGAEVSLLPGKTYIHVVPNKPALAEHIKWVQIENTGDAISVTGGSSEN